ncbi:L(+)-tartrate dehydratase subunit alpha [Methanolapillus ohkumae]|uniref:L(+)-tartrate dehydratase subunit alpha n=1 Tax=Methanolapillus ohkumae TaxID=3028298 RepID=A0AA96V495_9EURY|nr:L(+)-tartrate dehydratase subunit alpha [Methanosarcinaceae archaeon Am2]
MISIPSLSFGSVTNAVVEILRESEIHLPQDVVSALRAAAEKESNPTAKTQLHSILKNIEIAAQKGIPICQDTGIFIFFVEIGRGLCIDFDLEGAIRDGCAQATQKIPLRPNVVDPLSRHNTKNNLGDGLPEINYAFVPGKTLKITVAPKGAGSENMSTIRMFNPTEVSKIMEFVAKTVLDAGGKPCPPVVIGIGIGGSFNQCAKLAKEALLFDIGKNPEDALSQMESEILTAVNSLGIGCMGLGGDTTALSVRIKKASCHTASLPVAINIQCWANRHATAFFEEE